MTPKVVQIDIPVSNLEEALTFYESVLSLKASPAEIYGRVILEVPDGSQVGLALVLNEKEVSLPKDSPPSLPGIAVYLEVENLSEILSQCRSLGRTCSEAQKNPPYGFLAWIEDPFENRIHLCQPFKS
ncbi:MAG: VOC family protein [Pseudomonadota bacterium]